MRIRTTNPRGASPHPLSTAPAPEDGLRPGHAEPAPPPVRGPRPAAAHPPGSGLLARGSAVLVPGDPRAVPRGVGADRAPDTATPRPLAAPRQVTSSDGEVGA
jgi:hypothetical protein